METNEEDNKVINVSFNFAKTIFSNINNDIYKKLELQMIVYIVVQKYMDLKD